MEPKASVLIPVFNAAPWIGGAIESALGQRNVSIEVIVVDDGSSDGSLDIIRRYDDQILWEQSDNRGAPATRNRLLELAQAPWVQYLDADDYLMPSKIANQLNVVGDGADIDVLYGPTIIEWHGRDEVQREVDIIPEPHDPWILLAGWRLPQTGAPLWNKKALQDVGGWSEAQPCCQEHELYLRLLIAGKRFAYHSTSGAVYRRFTTGTLSTRDPSLVRRERAKIEARMEAYLKSIGSLTAERQWAIDQARFELARSAWPQDRSEARAHHSEISSSSFMPTGSAAPLRYQAVYRSFGFEWAERFAAFNRLLVAPAPKQTSCG